MSDEERIRRTYAEFCHALDNRQFEEWSQLFTEDGEFAGPEGSVIGREAILAMISGGTLARTPNLRRKHTIHNLVLDVRGDEATGVCDLVQFDLPGAGPYEIVIGKYVDRLARQSDGRWLFAFRQVTS